MSYDSYYSPDYYSELESLMSGFVGLSGLALIGVILLIGVVIALAFHYLEAIPTFIIAKKNGFRHAWVALIPIHLCITYVLSGIPGERDTKVAKWTIKSKTAFLVYLLIAIVGTGIAATISGLIGGVLGLIPFIGVFLSALIGTVIGLIPAIACILFEHAFLRDVINVYNTDAKSSSTTALIVVIVNYFIKIVRPIYLWTLVGKQPIHNRFEAEFTEVP